MRGFTLIELLIVITITSILVSTASLSIYGFFARQNLTLTRNEIIAVLREAQNKSILGQDGDNDGNSDNWGVHFENSTNDFYKIFYNNYSSSSLAISSYNLEQGVMFLIPAEGKSEDIIFSHLNGLPNASSTVKICLKHNHSSSITINISKNGKISY